MPFQAHATAKVRKTFETTKKVEKKMLRNIRNIFQFEGRPFRPPLARGVAICDPLKKK
jgi:hypothetical protein